MLLIFTMSISSSSLSYLRMKWRCAASGTFCKLEQLTVLLSNQLKKNEPWYQNCDLQSSYFCCDKETKHLPLDTLENQSRVAHSSAPTFGNLNSPQGFPNKAFSDFRSWQAMHPTFRRFRESNLGKSIKHINDTTMIWPKNVWYMFCLCFFSRTYATNDTLILQIYLCVRSAVTWEHSADSPRQVRKTKTPSNLDKPTQSPEEQNLSILYKLFQILQSNFTHLRQKVTFWDDPHHNATSNEVVWGYYVRPEDHDRGVQLLWKNSDVRSKLTCLDFQYHSGLSAEDILTNWHSRVVAFFFRDQKPPKKIQLPNASGGNLILGMQPNHSKWQCVRWSQIQVINSHLCGNIGKWQRWGTFKKDVH